MKNRIELAKYFAELGFTNGAEIGVDRGNYSKILLDNIHNLKLRCIDSWDTKGSWREGRHTTAVRELGVYPGATIIRLPSRKASEDVPDGSLDFVFIDADHSYEAVKDDIDAWAKKVRKGGIISGHDYVESRYKSVDVIRAVDEYVKEHNLKLLLTDWDMTVENHDNRQPCWYIRLE